MFDYWEKQPDERRHWQTKVFAAAGTPGDPGERARALERELWAYFVERTPFVPQFRILTQGGQPRVSFLNLADHLIRLWGPPLNPKKPVDHPAN